MSAAEPVNPQRVYWELSPRLPENCILSCDSGTSAAWYARDLKIRPGMMASLSGGLATMGCGVPYAIAAKFVHPERVAIALVGGLGQKQENAAEQEHGGPRLNTGVITYETNYRVIPDSTPARNARTLILKTYLQHSKHCRVAQAT